MKRSQFIFLACIAALSILALAAYMPARAGTVVASSSTYSGADEAGFGSTALPKVGAYVFDLVAVGTPTTTTAFTSFSVYLQQEGISGELYTIYNSTFTSCSGKCVQRVNPDIYLGGNVRARWSVTSGSVTFTVTAREVTP